MASKPKIPTLKKHFHKILSALCILMFCTGFCIGLVLGVGLDFIQKSAKGTIMAGVSQGFYGVDLMLQCWNEDKYRRIDHANDAVMHCFQYIKRVKK